jgi:hypothetical protein
MANVTKKYINRQVLFGGVPYGNKTTLQFTMETDASGIMTDSDQTTAIAATNVVRLGILPAGATLLDALIIVSDVGQTSSTCDIGFAYVDGVDSTAVPEDADYFTNDLDLASLGRTRADNTAVAPVTLPKDAYLTLLNNTADQDEVMRVDVLVDVILTGTP